MQAGRYWRTLRHLRPVQVCGRLWFHLARPRPDLSAPPDPRQVAGPWQLPAQRLVSLTGPGAFRFLNEAGSLLEHGWDGLQKARLWRYNQHYFDDLNAADAQTRSDWHHALIADWIARNPPGAGTGWEPYPTSLRIVNWVKWSLSGNTLSADAVASLAVQARWLTRRLEWHLLGNHLFSNAKALVFAGLFFDGPEAQGWLRKGLSILAREIPEQILPDGGQFELSPMYHALAVEDMLDLVNIAMAFGRDDLVRDWRRRIPAMLDWLMAMSHPDGDISFFNDAAFGIAPSNSELIAYARRLEIEAPASQPNLVHLAASGYVRMQVEAAVVIADVAHVGPDYLPGHAHADTLSFEMSLHGRRLIVNSGTSVYGTGQERLRQRSTAAHSTLVIDGQNSSEVWSGFRVGRRARPFAITARRDGEALFAGAAHDGYAHLRGAPIHHRHWRLESGSLEVCDRVTGQGVHRLEARFHLGRGLEALALPDGALGIADESGRILARVSAQGGRLATQRASWHPEFGVSIETRLVRLATDTTLPHAMTFRIDWPAE
jgi:uncharacterized heparinase superfamily protein